MPKTFSECPACHAVNRVDTDGATKKTPVCGKCGAVLAMHGLVSQVSATGLQKILESATTPVVVDFWASWCGPCRAYAPEYELASIQIPGAVFLKVDTEAEPQLSSRLGIRGIPCTILFKGGKEVARQAGAMSAEQVRGFLQGAG